MDIKAVKNYLEQTWTMLNDETGAADRLILTINEPEEVRQHLKSSLPDAPSTFEALLCDFKEEVLPGMNHNTSPLFGAYITGSGNHVGAVAEFIKAFYNQNGLKWNNSPITSELEQLVLQWIATFCKIPEHSKGVLTSGGSMSNYLAVHFALTNACPEREMKGLQEAPLFTVYCSEQAHSSFERAMVFLGLGRSQLRKIPVNKHFQIQTDHLKQTLDEDIAKGFRPLMVVGNAGTTNTGSIDNLSELAAIAKGFQLWYHVDGAYGLPAVRLPEIEPAFNGFSEADSVTINPHKWMYVPFEASCILVKEIPEAIHFSPDYLYTSNPGSRWESSAHTIELTKEFRALKVWFTMKYFGTDQLTSFVRKDIELIQYLAKELRAIPYIEVEANHPLSILCFRYRDPAGSEERSESVNVKAVRQIERDGRIFITGTRLHGATYLRVYFGHPDRSQEDVDTMVQVILEIFKVITS